MFSSPVLSDLLGYTSLSCFLVAQFPFSKTYAVGLARVLHYPFLLTGSLVIFPTSSVAYSPTNFLFKFGTLSPHHSSLPDPITFVQTYLAAYSVFINAALITQYFYYSTRTSAPTLNTTSTYPARTASTSPSARKGSIGRGTTRYRTFSVVAANEAAAAALGVQLDDRPERHGQLPPDLVLRPGDSGSFTSHITFPPGDREDSNKENVCISTDSFHPEGGGDARKRRISWSVERHRKRAISLGHTISAIVPPFVSAPGFSVDGTREGSASQRNGKVSIDECQADIRAAEEHPTTPTITNRRCSRTGKKNAAMAFLGAWALFGVGTLAGSRRGLPIDVPVSKGQVISSWGPSEELNTRTTAAFRRALPDKHPLLPNLTLRTLLTFENQVPPPESNPVPPSPEPYPTNPSADRVLGRIFAWLCTTLYLTSRLPQIWKNYVRKSVEGLSMYLFISAFLGNVFYVASILSSPNMNLPPPESTAFLKESIPYLLGSGGVLVFDIAILTQSFVYKRRHKKRYTQGGSGTLNLEVGEDTEGERAGLLAGDALTHHQPYSHMDSDSRLPSHPYSTGSGAAAPFGHHGVTRGRATQNTGSLDG